MRYCALDNLPRLANHLFVNDGKLRKKIVKRMRDKGNYPYMIDKYKGVGEFSFQLLGDTGEGDRSQDVLVEDLVDMPNQFPDTQFAIILGDIVYPDGSLSDYAQRFFQPYRNYPLPVYGITGNHDWYSKLKGYQKHFLGESDFGEKFNRPNVNQPNIYFFIETQYLRIICLDSGKKGKKIDKDQLQWLHEVCQREPQDKMKLLLLHHPLYSEDKRKKIAKQLEPLVNQYRIKLVVVAHVHNYQKYTIKDPGIGHTVIYIINGAGGAGLSPTHKLAREKLVEDFYPSVKESNDKFSKIFGLIRPPSWLTTCKDNYPYYKSFVNIFVKRDQLEVTVFKKKGFREPLERSSFTV